MTQLYIHREVFGLFGDLRSRGKRAVRSKEAEEDLGRIRCRPADYVHVEVGFVETERCKVWEPTLGCRRSIWSEEGKCHTC